MSRILIIITFLKGDGAYDRHTYYSSLSNAMSLIYVLYVSLVVDCSC
jgi:hypothetical protein